VAMALLGVLFFVLLVLLYLINRNRTNMNNALTAHRLAIDNKNMELEKLNQTKDKFFSVVAHDMRSPMNSLFGFSKLLAKHADSMSKEEIKKMGEQLSESVSNTLKMTENLITWARSQMMLEQTNPEMISVSDAVNETIKVFLESAEKKGVSLNKAEMNGEHVYADKNHFLLILRNLISNAIKYTTSGDSICVSASQENGNTKIVVEDTGMGIEDDVKARLFSLEGTVSQVGTSGERGTGLGLVMCKDFAERNNGSIRVQSERRKGTSFVVLLPSAN
ncbi:MAG: HAMP domain-containing sensor histidine kinase, partial [Cyclobacteriaceae bacterium]